MLINEFPFEPKAPASVVDKATKWLVDTQSRCSRNANYAKFSGDNFVERFDAICHAGISNQNLENVDCVATHNRSCDSSGYFQDHVKETQKFRDWFVNESFASRFILNPSDTSVGFVISADIPAPLLQNICIVSRHFKEVPWAFDKFDRLVSEGMNPFLAYFLAFTYGTGIIITSTAQVKPQVGHRAWGYVALQQLRNLCEGNFVRLDSNPKHFYRVYSNYNGGVKYGLPKNVPLLPDQKTDWIAELMRESEEFRERLAKERHVPVEKYRPPNPFVRQSFSMVEPISTISFKEFDDVLIPYLLERGLG